MKQIIFFVSASIFMLTACEKSNDQGSTNPSVPTDLTYEFPQNSSREEDRAEVDSIFNEATMLTVNVPCNDPTEFSVAPYGSKPCGGPWGYMSYPNSVAVQFLSALNLYKAAEHAFNNKWGAISDCALPAEPKGVRCEDGLAVLSYD